MPGINPSAGSFVPQGFLQANDHPTMENDSANLTQYLEAQIDGLRGAVVGELCSLRRDVDVLRSGGWHVKVGPFEKTKNLGDAEVAAIHQQITARLRLNLTPPNGSLYLDGVSEVGGVKHDSPMKAAPASKSMVPASNGLATQLPVRTQAAAATTTEPWKPAFIRTLKPLEDLKVPSTASMKSFSRDFINITFQGTEHSPSLFYTPESVEQPLLPQRTYYLMDSTVEPYLPASPGQHGAKLTPFFNNKAPEGDGSVSYENVPLFVASSKWLREGKGKANEYIYFGTYSQTRWSDKLDADRVKESVPLKVKQYWACTLADPGRASWMTEVLMKHFFPPPEYEGSFPKEQGDAEGHNHADAQMEVDVVDYVMELKAWKKFAKLQIASMSKEKLLAAFDLSDADQPAGLRLWWEYLECVQWDEGFYNMLVKRQDLFNNKGRHS